MKKGEGTYNAVVIGAGSGGLVTAAGLAGLGARVALIEKGRMGGDCLNTGCVPSKALIKSARVAHEFRTAQRFGLTPPRIPGRMWARCSIACARCARLWSLTIRCNTSRAWGSMSSTV